MFVVQGTPGKGSGRDHGRGRGDGCDSRSIVPGLPMVGQGGRDGTSGHVGGVCDRSRRAVVPKGAASFALLSHSSYCQLFVFVVRRVPFFPEGVTSHTKYFIKSNFGYYYHWVTK